MLYELCTEMFWRVWKIEDAKSLLFFHCKIGIKKGITVLGCYLYDFHKSFFRNHLNALFLRNVKTSGLQLNLHETDLLFWYLSHHLTWHCFSISEDLHRFARNLQHMNIKLFLLLFLNNFKCATPRNNNKNNFAFIFYKFLANLFKFSEILE